MATWFRVVGCYLRKVAALSFTRWAIEGPWFWQKAEAEGRPVTGNLLGLNCTRVIAWDKAEPDLRAAVGIE